ncbi:hypothetical protein CORC01_11601 [Colletotrichum orchidophilum]|uniref:Uncharacterized protein n=1 Tax=Colletotrichum orchidophilum TaxID=1209926 RepID=A0A1G4AVN2_9PEZI|nr:uncharacterized protein CORC01_11601 [Colletotrichum orchidophilum]OHE93112.1 hypothetical protein CORC01_11601 [Colletotrichum orchidophilum]
MSANLANLDLESIEFATPQKFLFPWRQSVHQTVSTIDSQLKNLAKGFSSMSVEDLLKEMAEIIGFAVLSGVQAAVGALLNVLIELSGDAIGFLDTKLHIDLYDIEMHQKHHSSYGSKSSESSISSFSRVSADSISLTSPNTIKPVSFKFSKKNSPPRPHRQQRNESRASKVLVGAFVASLPPGNLSSIPSAAISITGGGSAALVNMALRVNNSNHPLLATDSRADDSVLAGEALEKPGMDQAAAALADHQAQSRPPTKAEVVPEKEAPFPLVRNPESDHRRLSHGGGTLHCGTGHRSNDTAEGTRAAERMRNPYK